MYNNYFNSLELPSYIEIFVDNNDINNRQYKEYNKKIRENDGDSDEITNNRENIRKREVKTHR